MNTKTERSGSGSAGPSQTIGSTQEHKEPADLSRGSDRLSQIADLIANQESDDDEQKSGAGEVREPPDQDEAGTLEGGGQDGDRAGSEDGDADGDAGERTAGEAGGVQEADEEGQERQLGQLTVKELAEELGTSAGKIYDTLQVPLGKGQTVSLSELKKWGAERITQDQWRQEQASEFDAVMEQRHKAHRAWVEVHELAEHLQAVPPQVLEQMRARRQQRVDLEGLKLKEVIPELADDQRMAKFKSGAADTLADYGFHRSEIIIEDHRIARVLYDFMKLKALVENARNWKPKPAEAPKSKQSGVKRQEQKQRPADRTTQREKASQVAQILGAR